MSVHTSEPELGDEDREALDIIRDAFVELRDEHRATWSTEPTAKAKAELQDALVALVRMRRGAP